MKSSRGKELLSVLAILVIASFFRLSQLEKLPMGLDAAEARNAVQALTTANAHNSELLYWDNSSSLFINIESWAVSAWGNNAFAMRVLPALAGILAIFGLYLLTRELFNWHIAAISAAIMAISFWPVSVSRLGIVESMIPAIMLFSTHFLWRGLKTHHLHYFFWAGLLTAVGICFYPFLWLMPVVFGIVFINYWGYLKKDFSDGKYEHAKNQLLRGFALMTLVVLIAILPLVVRYLTTPSEMTWLIPNSIAHAQNVGLALLNSIGKSLGMFNFSGDISWLHNISSSPVIPWPIGIFFAIGFIKELIHFFHRKHGYFSSVHVLIFSWFFVMLVPSFLSRQTPDSLLAFAVMPIVMLLIGRGIWWTFQALGQWYEAMENTHMQSEVKGLSVLILLILLTAFGFYEYYRYFYTWGASKEVAQAFQAKNIETAAKINHLPLSTPKVIIITNETSQNIVQYFTDTTTLQTQKAVMLQYITKAQASIKEFPANTIIIKL